MLQDVANHYENDCINAWPWCRSVVHVTSHVAIYNVTGFTAFQCLDNMSTGIGQCPCIRQIKSETLLSTLVAERVGYSQSVTIGWNWHDINCQLSRWGWGLVLENFVMKNFWLTIFFPFLCVMHNSCFPSLHDLHNFRSGVIIVTFLQDYDADIDMGEYKCCIINYSGHRAICDAETFTLTSPSGM